MIQKAILGFIGAILTTLASIWVNVAPLVVIAFAMIIWDCFEAFLLSRRVKAKYGSHKASGKFKSHSFGKAINNAIKVLLGISLAFFIYDKVLVVAGKPQWILHYWFTGAVVIWQLWSIIENASSCNGSKGAKVLQRIVMDKTQRHFDIKSFEEGYCKLFPEKECDNCEACKMTEGGL